METEYAGKGVAGTGLGLGIAGTALGLLNGGLGILGGNGGPGPGPLGGNRGGGVTQDQIRDQAEISKLRSDLALSEAKYANEVGENTKLVDVYRTLATRDRELEGRITKVETENAAERAVFREYQRTHGEADCLRAKIVDQKIDNVALVAQNGISANSSAIQCLQNTVNGIVKTVVPNSNVCPGWGRVTITPSTSTTVTDA